MTSPAPSVGITSTPRQIPYMSYDMFATHAQRGVDVDSVVPNGKMADQEGAIREYIEEASSWMDHITQQTTSMAATYLTTLDRVNVGRDGWVTIHPKASPLIAVTAFAIGSVQSQLTPYADLSQIKVTRHSFTVGAWGSGLPVYSSQGPLQFGVGAPMDQAWYQSTTISGYPITWLAAPIAAGDTSISLADITGIIPGNTWMTVYTEPGHRFTFLAGAVTTATPGLPGPGTVAMAAAPWAVSNVGSQPVMVSAADKSLISACALATRSFIKDSNPGAATNTTEGAPSADDDLAEAAARLRDFVATPA